LIAVGDWTGRSTPLHCVASGKVLLSSLAEREVLRIVRRGLVSSTERTIVQLEPLLEELARIRRRGYATAIGEYELGLNAVAAPVYDARGNVIAAVDLWGPAFRPHPRPRPAGAGGRGRDLRPPGRRGRLTTGRPFPDSRGGGVRACSRGPDERTARRGPDRTVAGALPARADASPKK